MTLFSKLKATDIPQTFTGTNNVVVQNSSGNRDVRKFDMQGNSVQSNLPEGYTQLSYIESTGTQYIDTGLVIGANDVIDITYDYVANGFVCGVRVTASSGYSGITNESYGNLFHIRMGDAIVYTATPHPTGTVKVHIESGNITINDTQVSTETYGINFADLPFYLFNINNSGSILSEYGANIIREFKVTRSGSVIQNLIPAKRNSDSVIGMYDTVTNTFYTNAGTGDFVAGEEMPSPTNPIEIQSVGDKTSNLFDGNWYLVAQKILKSTEPITLPVSISRAWQGPGFWIPVEYGKTYTLSVKDFINSYNNSYLMWFNEYSAIPQYDTTGNFLVQTTSNVKPGVGTSYTIKNESCKYILVSFASYKDDMPFDVNVIDCMIEEGSTATAYEPYGYKVPIVCTNQAGTESKTVNVFIKEQLRKIGT